MHVDSLKVSATTDPEKLGWAISRVLIEKGQAEVTAMGAQAIQRAVKGIIQSKSFLAPQALSFSLDAGYRHQRSELVDGEITVIIFVLTLND